MTAAWPAIPSVQYAQLTRSPVDQRTLYQTPASLPKAGSLSTDTTYAVSFDVILSGDELSTFMSWWNGAAALGAEQISGLQDIISDDPNVLYVFKEPPTFTMLRSGSSTIRRYRASFRLVQVLPGSVISTTPSGTVVLDSAIGVAASGADVGIIRPDIITLDSATVGATAPNDVLAPDTVLLTTGTVAVAGFDVSVPSVTDVTLDSGVVNCAAVNDVLANTVQTLVGAAAASAIGADMVPRTNALPVHFSGTNYLQTTAWSATAGKIFVFSAWVRIPTNISGPCNLFQIQNSTANNVVFFIGDDGKFYAHLRTVAGGSLTLDCVGSTDLRTNTWSHILFSCDMASTANRGLVINRVDTSVTWITYVNQNLNWAITTSTIGATWDGSNLRAFDIAEVFLGFPGAWFDPNNATNLAKFIDASGFPVPLGTTGANPLGTQSKLCMNNPVLANWHTNVGSGGGYTEISGPMTLGPGPVFVTPPTTAVTLASAAVTCAAPTNVLASVKPLLDSPATVAAVGNDLGPPVNALIATGSVTVQLGVDVTPRAIGTAVHFSGTNYLKTTAWAPSIPAATSGKIFVFSAWVKIPVSLSASCWLFEIQTSISANNCFFSISSSDGRASVHLRNTAGGSVVLDATGSQDLRTNVWHHIMWTIDMTSTSRRALVIDKVVDNSVTWNTYANNTINWTAATATIGARTDGSSRQSFDMAEVLLSCPASWVDPTIPNNLQQVITDSGYPTALGTGLNWGGLAPLCMNAATLAAWHTNNGNGGGFTETSGALTAGSGPVVSDLFTETWTGSNGAAWPSANWTGATVTSTSVIDIQSNAGRLLPQGAVYAGAWINARVGIRTKIDLTFSVTLATTGEQYLDIYVRSNGETSAPGRDGEPASCYRIEVDGLNNAFTYRPIVNSVLGTLVSVPKTWGTGTWSVRIQCNGTNIRARAWQGAEPSTWDLNRTDSQIASGGIRFAAFNGNAVTARSMSLDNLTLTSQPA